MFDAIDTFLGAFAGVLLAHFFWRVAFPRERRHLGGGSFAPMRNQNYDHLRVIRSGRVVSEFVTTENLVETAAVDPRLVESEAQKAEDQRAWDAQVRENIRRPGDVF